MRLLLVFVKEPIEGRVKTRLADEIGKPDATRYYRAMVEVLLKQLHGLENCRIRFCFTPDDAEDAMRFWLLSKLNATSEGAVFRSGEAEGLLEIDFQAQGEGNLGDRLERAFQAGFREGFRQIAVIGSDCPQCGARWINAAMARLSNKTSPTILLGPSQDGGYYLLATNQNQSELFRGISWSSSQVAQQTLDAATQAGLEIETLPELRDVDTHADWLALLDSPLGPSLKKNLGIPLDEENI